MVPRCLHYTGSTVAVYCVVCDWPQDLHQRESALTKREAILAERDLLDAKRMRASQILHKVCAWCVCPHICMYIRTVCVIKCMYSCMYVHTYVHTLCMIPFAFSQMEEK